ncbi:MAG TPA: polyprenyl synthetase family protein [Symbiobacteriaceae bacterium]
MDLKAYPDLLKSLVDRQGASEQTAVWQKLGYLACRVGGGGPDLAATYSEAAAAYFAAADVLDEVQDEDEGGALWQEAGAGVAVNAGTGLLVRSLEMVANLNRQGVAPERVLQALRILTVWTDRACRGQHLDLVEGSSPQLTFSRYYRIVDLKSGSLVAALCAAGAVLGGAGSSTAAALASFGRHLGIALQVANDSRSLLLREQGKSDWRQGRRTFPILYAYRHAADPRCQRFCHLFETCRTDPDAQAEMIRLLTEVGGFLFADRIKQMELDTARRRLARLAPSPWRDQLEGVTARL